MKKSHLIAASLVAGSLIAASNSFARGPKARARLYEVVITNITRGQILSPPVVFTHRPSFELFTLGQPARPEVAAVAEDAVNAPLQALLASSPMVFDQQTGGMPIPPGQSMALEVYADQFHDRLSAIGMLVVTNDAFFGANGLRLPRRGERTYRAVAYDAGSEGNSELCAEIPGPPCGNPGVRNTATAEGFVHVHAGIHGIGDLSPEQHDWRNPTVEITVRRIH